MPAVKAPAAVLVTGASGFIAASVCKILLEHGYTVKGTVRSKDKGDYLQSLFNKDHAGKFSYVLVEDIEKPDAFNSAVQGVDAVLHTASPFHFQAQDPQELIGPAVQGTTGILSAIQSNTPKGAVRRVVVTSSVAAILSTVTEPTVFTEADWNDESPKEIEEHGAKASAVHKYRASKSLAERAAWNFVASKDVEFDLVTINPPMVFGPFIHQVSSPSSLNTSVASLHALIHKKPEELTEAYLLAPNSNFVDVRDVALAHVRALEVEEAGGQRFIASGGSYTWQDVLDVINESKLPSSVNIPKGNPGSGGSAIKHNRFSTEKATKVLGIQFKGLGEVVGSTVEALVGKGWA